MSAYYPTGIPAVDDNLNGGLPPGSLAVLETPPASAGVLVAAAFASIGTRPTAYLTTDRHPDQIEADVRAAVNRPAVNTDGLDHLVISETDDPTTLERTDWQHATARGGHTESPDDTDATNQNADDGRDADARSPPKDDSSHPTPESANSTTDELGVPDTSDSTEEATGLAVEAQRASQRSTTGSGHQNTAPFCLVFDTISALTGGWEEDSWQQAITTIQHDIRDLGGIALVVLLRDPTTSPSAAGQRILHRADGVFSYQPATNSKSADELVVRRVSNAAADIEPFPFSVELQITDSIERNPDDSYS